MCDTRVYVPWGRVSGWWGGDSVPKEGTGVGEGTPVSCVGK